MREGGSTDTDTDTTVSRISLGAVLLVQLIGAALSAFLVIVTYANPAQVEAGLQRFAIAKVEAAADAAWQEAGNRLEGTGLSDRLGSLASQFARDADTIEEQRKALVPAVVGYALSDKCKENCAGWLLAGQVVNEVLIARAAQMRVGETTLLDFIQSRYDSTVAGLKTDLRRFGMVNLVALLLMAALLWVRHVLNWRFVALSVAITGYTAWAAYGYVVQQNWAMAIMTQNWAGPGYQVAMIVVSLFCIDWLFLRGAVSQTIANALSSLIPG